MKNNNLTAEAKLERISREPNIEDAWVCVCGNTPADDGFYPCNEKGIVVEPVVRSDWEDLYICFGCGRIINQETLEVVGQNTERLKIAFG